MPTYSYIAKKPDGAETRGTLDAASADAAREELRKRGVMIEDIRELPAPGVYSPPQRVNEKKPKPAPLPWSPATNAPSKVETAPAERAYAPLHETLRIFAGWLLGWYGLIYALGFLEQTKRLPELPFVRELFVSPLVLQFTFGTFLFLALSNVHRWIGRGTLAGFVLAVLWIAGVAGFVIYG